MPQQLFINIFSKNKKALRSNLVEESVGVFTPEKNKIIYLTKYKRDSIIESYEVARIRVVSYRKSLDFSRLFRAL